MSGYVPNDDPYLKWGGRREASFTIGIWKIVITINFQCYHFQFPILDKILVFKTTQITKIVKIEI